MLQISENEVSVHLCTFQANFQKAKVNLRFPSLFFVEWKAINNKNSVSTIGRKKAVNSLIELDEDLTFSTEMIYHRIQKQYLKKQSLIHLNLISNSRPDQIKLVGRVIIDLAQVANKNNFADVTNLKLMYCSVDAELTFKIKFVRSIQSNIQLNQLDKSAFSDLYSFTSPKLGMKNKLELRESLSEKRSGDQRRKLPKIIDREEIINTRPTQPLPKIQKILIKQQIEQTVQYDNPRSLPLSQKKKSLKDLNEYRAQQRRAKPVIQIPESAAQQVQTIIMKERNLLQHELNEHKDRIKKLENDIMAALRLFEESESKSELNKSKLIESQQAIHQLLDKENKLKDEYQKLLAAQNEQHQKQISIIKSGYEADIKILQATMEQERTKLVQLQKTSKNLLNNYQEAKTKLKEQQLVLQQVGSNKNEIDALKIERDQLLLRLGNKQADKTELESLRRRHQEQIIKAKGQFQAEISKINALLKTKQEAVLNIQQTNQSLVSQLNALCEQNTQRSIQLQIEKQNHHKAVQSFHQQIALLKTHKQQRLTTVHEQVITLKSRIIQLQSTLSAQKTSFEVIRTSNQQQLMSLRSQNEQLRNQNQNTKQTIQRLTDQQNQIKLELDHFRTKNRQLTEVQPVPKQFVEHRQPAIPQQSSHRTAQNLQNVSRQNWQVKNLKQLKHIFEAQTQENKLLRQQLQNLAQTVRNKEQQIIVLRQQIAKLNQPISLNKVQKQQKVQEVKQIILQSSPVVQKSPLKQQKHLQIKEEVVQVTIPADTHAMNLNFDFLSNNFNKSAQVSEQDRHRFHFEEHGSPLTNQEINKISTNVNSDVELTTLKEQNIKLKEEIEYLEQLAAARQGQNLEHIKQKQNLICSNSKIVQTLQQERLSLNEQLICLNQQIKVLNERPTLQIGDVKPVNLHNLTLYHKIEQYKRIISQQYEKHQFLESRIYQLEGLLSKNNQKLSHIEKDEHYIQDLEQKLANLEEQMKIKDQLLAQSEKNMEESYANKYQLADLKQKLNQLESALDQRDIYINELQETKQYLAKELQQTSPHKNRSFELKLQKVENEFSQMSSNMNVSHLNHELADFKSQIEELNRQLIIYNNENTELKNKSQDWNNEKVEIQSRLQLANLKLIECQNTITQLKVQKQKIQLQLNEQRAKQDENRQKINEQIGLLTGKLMQMENNIRAIPDNETELSQLRQAVQSLNFEKQVLNEDLSQKTQSIRQLSSQVQTLNRGISQLQTLNRELLVSLKIAEKEFTQKRDYSQRLQNQLTQSKQINESINQMLESANQMASNLGKQLEQANLKIEQLRKQIEQIAQYKQRIEQDTINRHDLSIEINVHKVDSYAEDAPPIVYEKSVIQADDYHLNQNQVTNNKEYLERLSQQNLKSTEDNRVLSQVYNKLKSQEEVLHQQVDRCNKLIEKIQAQLAQQNEQKFYYFNEVQNYKALVQKLQKQLQANNEKNERMNILPLQSFDTNHLLRLRHHQQVITEDEKERQPSILQQIEVHAQPQINQPHQEQTQSLQFKKGVEPKTQVETNMTEQLLVALKQDLELVRQQLQKQKKQHRQLQDTHQLCNKKYETLSVRYENCFNELEYVQGEVDKPVKYKQKIEQELYRCKVVIQNLNQEQLKIVQENKQLKQRINAQENRQTIVQIDEITQPNINIQVQVPKVQHQIQVVNQTAQNEIANRTQQNNLQKQEYQNKISQLLKSQQQYKNKTALLQQNIQNLQTMLQEQIEINQNNQKLTEKLQTLHELEAMAEQVRSEMTILKKENMELKRMKSQSDIVPHQKGELTKIIEEYQAMNNPKEQLKPKLQQIEEMHSNTTSHLQTMNNKAEDKIVEPIQTIKQQEEAKPQANSQLINMNAAEIKAENRQTFANSEVSPRNQILLQQIEKLRRQKLQNLQKMYSLQQKLNEISSIKTARQQHNEQQPNLRLHQIEQVRFANEQIRREYEQQKIINSELQAKKQQIRIQFEQLISKYQQANNEIQRLNKSIGEYVESINHYQAELAELHDNIFALEEERGNTDHMNNQVQKVKLELDNKIAQIQQLATQKTELAQQIVSLNEQIFEMRSVLQNRDQQKLQKQAELKSLGQLHAQITQQKQAIQQQLKKLLQKSSRLQQQLSILKNRGQSKDQRMTSLNNQLNQAQKKIAALNAKIKTKQQQALAFIKENQQLKSLNEAHQHKIKLLDEKQKQMKETVAQLQLQSRKIVDSLKQRFVSEANYYKKYVEKEKECSSLSAAAVQYQQSIANKDRQLTLQRQIASQLRNQLDVLKNGAGAQQFPQILTIQIEKYDQLKDAHQKLMNVNKEYLENIGKKSTINIENQRLKQQLKTLTLSLNQTNSMLNQIKAEYQSKKVQYSENLAKLQTNLAAQSQKVIELTKEVMSLKQGKVGADQKYYDSLIKQKNKQIETLRKQIADMRIKKQSEVRQEFKQTPSQLDILNEQVYNLSNDILDKERQISQLRKELDNLKQSQLPVKQKSRENSPFKRTASQPQVQAVNRISQIQQQLSNFKSNIQTTSQQQAVNNQDLNAVAQQLSIICQQIKQLCNARNSNNKQGFFEAFVKKYDQIEQQFQNMGLQTTQIQQKARFISKELQKLKAYIIKSQNRAFKQKTEILALIKPCEHTANQLISISETLNEGDSNAFL